MFVFFVVLPLFGAANTKSYGLKAQKSCAVSATLEFPGDYRDYIGVM